MIALPTVARIFPVSKVLAALWCAVGFIAVPASAQTAADWRVLILRDGGQVEYPADLLRFVAAEDGMLAYQSAGDVMFTLALETVLFPGEPVEELYERVRRGWAVRGFDISYRNVSSADLVLSGKQWNGDLIFYQRIRLSPDGTKALQFVLTYPAWQRSSLDAVVTRISRSFRFDG